MQVTINSEHTEPKPKYPWVGICQDKEHTTIVLFNYPKSGFCLDSTDEINIEDRYLTSWDESKFTPCSITLSSL